MSSAAGEIVQISPEYSAEVCFVTGQECYIVDDDNETSRIQEFINDSVLPLFTMEKKRFWWTVGFYAVGTGIAATNGFGMLSFLDDFLTKESPLDKALQTQLPPNPSQMGMS